MARKNDLSDLSSVLLVMSNGNTLRGKQFCVTGHLSITRAKFIELVEHLGGEYTKTPNYGVMLVTNNDWTAKTKFGDESIKLRKAEDRGCKIITEEQFYNMVTEADEAISAATE